MPNPFNSMINFEVKDGPKIMLKYDESVDAVDHCSYELKPDETKLFELQPASSAGQIRFLIVWRQAPDPKAEKPDPHQLTFKLNGKDESIPIDNQHVIIGYGLFNLFKEVPRTLLVTNAQKDPVKVTVLVGRDFPKYPAPDGPPPATDQDKTPPDPTS
jgi:hypothetical protein